VPGKGLRCHFEYGVNASGVVRVDGLVDGGGELT